MDTTVFETRIPLYETDMGGGMYHGNYFHLFDQAREHWLSAHGFPYAELVAVQRHLTVAHVKVRYHKPLLYNHAVRVETRPDAPKTRSFTVTQRVFRDETLCTEAEISLVCVDFSGVPQPLPDRLRVLLDPTALPPPPVKNGF